MIFPEHIRKISEKPGVSFTVHDYQVDMVYAKKDGSPSEMKVPLYHLYNHHFILFAGMNETIHMLYENGKGKDPFAKNTDRCPQNKTKEEGGFGFDEVKCRFGMLPHCLNAFKKGLKAPYSISQFGGAAGAEYRNNPHVYPRPFAAGVEKPEAYAMLIHAINTVNSTSHDDSALSNPVSPLLQCPCTKERSFDLEKGTIDGCKPEVYLSYHIDIFTSRRKERKRKRKRKRKKMHTFHFKKKKKKKNSLLFDATKI